MSVGPEHWPWQWWGRGGLGAADDLWEPEPEGSRENPRELKTNGTERQKVLHPQPPSIRNVCEALPRPLLSKHLAEDWAYDHFHSSKITV